MLTWQVCAHVPSFAKVMQTWGQRSFAGETWQEGGRVLNPSCA